MEQHTDGAWNYAPIGAQYSNTLKCDNAMHFRVSVTIWGSGQKALIYYRSTLGDRIISSMLYNSYEFLVFFPVVVVVFL